MSDQPTNPYEAPQSQLVGTMADEAKLIRRIGLGWERIANLAYDQTPFPRRISFDGHFSFRDFRSLGKRMFEHRLGAAIRIVIAQLVVFSPIMALGGLFFYSTLGIGLHLVVFFMMFAVLLGFGVYQARFRIPNDPSLIPIRGEIEPTCILSQLRDAETNTFLDTYATYPWNELFLLEDMSEAPRTEDALSREGGLSPLPAKLILFTKCRRNTWREKMMFTAHTPRFFEMFCLHPAIFSNPADWRTLVEFAREHLAARHADS